MASKSMQKLLNALLYECIENGTSAHDSGFTVSMDKKQRDEEIFFYSIDNRNARAKLGMLDEGIKICDYLISYTKHSEIKEVICFMELKGKNIGTAIKQILDTYERVVAIAKQEIVKEHHNHIKWKACICLHGSAPKRNQRLEDELAKKFGKENIRIRRDVRLGDFLRSSTNQRPM